MLEGGVGDDVLQSIGTETGSPLDKQAVHAQLLGGPGDDALHGGPGRESLSGDDGDDELLGSGGSDDLGGGAGADRLDGGEGDDRLMLDVLGDGAPDLGAGGEGRDVASFISEPRSRTRLVVDLADDRGPDGPATEVDALAGDIEDVEAQTAADSSILGSDGPNRLIVSGPATVDGRGGADELGTGRELRDGRGVRLIGGAGADVFRPGTGARVEARDGETDTVDCESRMPLRIDLDVGRDRATRCGSGLSISTRWAPFDRARRGGRFRFVVACHDPYHPCRVRMRPTLGRRRLAPITLRVPPAGRQRTSIRIPVDAPGGRQWMRLAARVASPFPGVPALRTTTGTFVRVLPRRG